METPDGDKVRLDKWLWAARFFKARAQATEAVEGGKVHVNGARAKPARPVRVLPNGRRVSETIGQPASLEAAPAGK